ncbi:MAG: glycogen synthase, partial [Gammaproteobacteria bacterium]|nr:glycogen synthase [Gammaproteobacteria bacterium]
CNDWQTGLAPAYLKLAPGSQRPLTGIPAAAPADPQAVARSVFTIHNLAYAGLFEPAVSDSLALPTTGFDMHGYEFHGRVGFLKAGLFYADWLTTVSPSYAREIQQPSSGHGLDGLLSARADRLVGILNGIDDELWNPATDPALTRPFDGESLDAKLDNKLALLQAVGLDHRPGCPLAVVVSRLTTQKGLDLLIPALGMLEGRELQLIVLGTGEAAIERGLSGLQAMAPERFRFIRRYDEQLAHQMEAGADLFLMPSRFEPCGLNQMYSMRYGTPPLVHRTGGLADTVVDANPDTLAAGTATGFVFERPDPVSLSEALCRALDLFPDRTQWRALQRAGMSRDFSWQHSAQQYRALYQHLLSVDDRVD